MHNVAVLDDVFFALHTKLAGSLASGFSAKLDIIRIACNLSFNEAALKVRMDNARRFRSLCSDAHGPCLHFHFTGSKVTLKAQKFIRSLCKRGKARAFKAERLQVLRRFLGIKLCKFCLNLGAHGNRLYTAHEWRRL